MSLPRLTSNLISLLFTGTFYSREKLRDVFEFVRQSLASDWQPFLLSEAGRQLTDENASLVDLGLVSMKNPLGKNDLYLPSVCLGTLRDF